MKTFAENLAELEQELFASGSGEKAVEVTENYIRVRVRMPSDFRDDTFKTVPISEEKGIFSVMGKLKENEGQESDPMVIQSLLFDKEKWTEEEAVAWARDHGYSPKSADEPILKHALKRKFILDSVKVLDGKERLIEGYASTNDVDRQNEIVDPQAFKNTLPRYLKNAIMFFGHEWFSLPIGRVLDAKITERGLWIKAYISAATAFANEVWGLIQEGVLKALSIGYDEVEVVEEPQKGIRTIKELELYEISIVSVPMQPEALFEMAKAKHLNLEKYKIFFRKENTVPDDLKIVVNNLQQLTTEIKDFSSKMNELQKRLGEDPSKVRPEDKEFYDAIKGKLETLTTTVNATSEKANAYFAEPQRKIRFDVSEADLDAPASQRFKGMSMKELLSGHYIKEPKGTLEGEIKRLQELSDSILICHNFRMAKYAHEQEFYAGIQTLRLYPEYKQLFEKVSKSLGAKAMDTAATGEGLEFVPTMFSAELHEMVRLEIKVAKLFRSYPMPSKIWEFPVGKADSTAKRVGETIAAPSALDTGEQVIATAKTTFTAKKARGQAFVSAEETEDSIIPILPYIKEDLARGIAKAVDLAIISGNLTDPHMDNDVNTGAADDFRRLTWNGVREKARTGSNTFDIGSASGGFNLLNVRTVRELLGRFGIIPEELAWIIPTKVYYKLIKLFTSIADMLGPILSWEKGKLVGLDAIEIVVSGQYPENLHTTGVNAAAQANNTTALSIVHKPTFALGVRRQTTFRSEYLQSEDQYKLTSFHRIDFEGFEAVAANNGPCAYGYNIP